MKGWKPRFPKIKVPPHLWIRLGYYEDGVSEYKCLHCKDTFLATGDPGYEWQGKYHPTWKYCPMCGIKWAGEGPTQTERPRWEFLAKARQNQKPFHAGFWWIIEVQTQWGDNPPHDWKIEDRFDPVKYSAHDVYRRMQEYRLQADGDDYFTIKYRARVVHPGYKQDGYHF